MPIVSHNKSRHGCNVCKKRKVKCGEELPACRNCLRRGEKCSYTPIIRFKSFSDSKYAGYIARDKLSQVDYSPNDSAQDEAAHYAMPNMFLGAGNTSSIRTETTIWELRLIHFFTISTCHTWSPLSELWMTASPAAAFQHDFLLDAILATASMHWCAINPQDRQWATAASAKYYARSIEGYTRSLEHVKEAEFALALLLASALITFTALVHYGNQDDALANPEEALLHWFRLAKGSKVLYGQNCDLFNTSDLFFQISVRSPDTYSDEVAFDPALRGQLSFLQDWSMEGVDLTEADIKSYEDSLSWLGFTQQTDYSNDHQVALTRRVVFMIARCSMRFSEFLEQRRPRALVIIAHAFATLKLVENDLWWIGNIPNKVMKTIYHMIPEQWQQLMPDNIRI